jgi:uncharacterized membrane protein
MTSREKPVFPADPPPPPRTPFDAAPEPVAEFATCHVCRAVVTPADACCPRCLTKVVPPGTKPIEAMRGNARMVYVLQALALFCGLPAVPGLLLAYANRGAARDTWLDSHCEWQIDTFWGMFWFWLAGIASWLVGDHFLGRGVLGHGPALLVMLGAAAWYVDRVVKGWTRLADGDPVMDY